MQQLSVGRPSLEPQSELAKWGLVGGISLGPQSGLVRWGLVGTEGWWLPSLLERWWIEVKTTEVSSLESKRVVLREQGMNWKVCRCGKGLTHFGSVSEGSKGLTETVREGCQSKLCRSVVEASSIFLATLGSVVGEDGQLMLLWGQRVEGVCSRNHRGLEAIGWEVDPDYRQGRFCPEVGP